MPDVVLSPPIAALAADLEIRDDGFAYDEAKLVRHAEQLLDRPVAEHRALAVEVLALMLKMEAKDAGRTQHARAQLLVVVAVLAQGASAQLLRDAGIEIDEKARAVVGTVAANLPIGARGRVEGAMSPLGVRLKKGDES